ncbi:hypothetical protein JOC75_001144 [Metabacillus crassostreae]|uniref:glycosyltransferase n=1 Tax=Metabacillus crassostreae TaxID=929098 RepID=UPI00195EBDCB|nr:hypothetical protein [Metabacillus crassostreae]
MSNEDVDTHQEGISVIIATNRINCLVNIFDNYLRQDWSIKELIIILNNDLMDLKEWELEAERYHQVTVFKLSEDMTLGKCLNYGVGKAKYKYIAKFDDDDYYGTKYLTESITVMKKLNAAVVGKRTCFMYLTNNKEIRVRFVGNEMRKVNILQGATIFTTKSLLQKIQFPDKNLGECLEFLQNCKKQGYKICSTSRYNYAILREDEKNHTWQPTDDYLFKTSKRVAFSEDYKNYVDEK